MTDAPTDDVRREILVEVAKAPDLDLHVSILHTPWADYAEIRDYVPSIEKYGRGVLIPASALEEVTIAMLSISGSAAPQPEATPANPGPTEVPVDNDTGE